MKKILRSIVMLALVGQSFIQINIQAMELKHELDKEEYELLKKTIKEGNFEESRNLIEQLNINLKSNYGTKLLMNAVANSNKSIIKLLLREGANINSKDENGNTVLIFAATYPQVNQKEIIELLIQNGANPRLKNNRGQNAYDMAIYMAENAQRAGKESEAYPEIYEKEYKNYIEIADLLKNYEQKYKRIS